MRTARFAPLPTLGSERRRTAFTKHGVGLRSISNERLPWIGLVLLAPISALFILAALALSTVSETSTRVESARTAAAFARSAVDVLEAVQSERSIAAALRVTPAQTTRQLYFDRTRITDDAIAGFGAISFGGRSGIGLDSGLVARLEASLSDLATAREAGADASVGLNEIVVRYSAVADRFISALAREYEAMPVAERQFAVAFVTLARLQEQVSMEVSMGLAAFSSGVIDPFSHRILLDALAPQPALIESFDDLTEQSWSDGLDAALDIDADRLAAAREALVQAGYGGALDTSHRAFWREERLPVYFALGAFRNRFAEEGIAPSLAAASAANERAVRRSLLAMLGLLGGFGAALFGLVKLTGRPEDEVSPAP